MNSETDNKKTPLLLIISDQILLKAANQVLFQTIRGYLDHGFRVNLILNGDSGHEEKNIAKIEDLFPDDIENINLKYYSIPLLRTFKFCQILFKKFKVYIKSEINKKLQVALLESNQISGFEGTRTRFTFISDFKFMLSIHASKKLSLQEIKREKPTVICGFEVAGAVVGEAISRKIKVPFFTKYMGTIVYPYIQQNRLNEVKPYMKGLKVKADLYFMLNDGTKGDKVLSYFDIPKDKIRFKIDGVDKEKFKNLSTKKDARKELDLNLKEMDFLCLCLSNHNAPYKRLDRAVRAVSEASKVNPRIKLVLVGEGLNTSSLKELSSSLEATNNILFKSKISHQDVPVIMSASDCYLNTNDVSNLSHTVLEAMSAGMPVISMNDGSLDQIIDNNINGILVNPSNCHEELPKAILELLDNREKLIKIGANAQNYALENFKTWKEKNSIEVLEVKEKLRI
tara:strand:+ start:82 stop:1446 length:1365 start_codon:yes stop_codon:yes gene_type:complete